MNEDRIMYWGKTRKPLGKNSACVIPTRTFRHYLERNFGSIPQFVAPLELPEHPSMRKPRSEGWYAMKMDNWDEAEFVLLLKTTLGIVVLTKPFEDGIGWKFEEVRLLKDLSKREWYGPLEEPKE